MTAEEHIDNLVRHIGLVRDACLRLGKRLMAQGRVEFGRLLIARGFVHDASKFLGIEWEYMRPDETVPEAAKQLAIEHHRQTNGHHPECWGGIENMPEIAVAEMVCDWYARSQEFGTDLREWVRTEAMSRYKMKAGDQPHRWATAFIDLLLDRPFAPVGDA
jgi:hypothetical protein